MIFSKRRREHSKDSMPIIIRATGVEPSFPGVKIPHTLGVMDDWRKRTDTDGTERRARQTKQDNELL